MICEHVTGAVERPSIIHLHDNLFVLRFESMKLVSALAAIGILKRRGVIAEGDTVIDSSSGIYAHALALACHRHGLKCRIIASKTVDAATRCQLEALGATVESVPVSPTLKLDQEQRVRRIRQILADDERVHWMRQYHDAVHYLGYRPIAAMIRQTFGGRDLTIVGGVGSGCSTGALGHYLRAARQRVRMCAVQPFGSVTFGADHVDDPEMVIAGIGSAIPFRNVHHQTYDEVHWISFAYALSGSISLLRNHGLFAGLSTGACFTIAEWARRRAPDQPHLLIAADTGHRYVDGVFSKADRALEVDALSPKRINDLGDLSLPWSMMYWARRAGPDRRGLAARNPVRRKERLGAAA